MSHTIWSIALVPHGEIMIGDFLILEFILKILIILS